jgi:hypothetical protein
MASFAPPPFDPDEIHPLFILGFALIVTMPDKTTLRTTLRADLWAGALLVFPQVNIILLVASKIG